MPNTIEKTPLKTKHARLADELRQRIRVGDLQPGDQLPSFAQFREQHGVTLPTIEKALSNLERDGLIERFRGKGVFVREKNKATKFLGLLSPKQGVFAWRLYWVPFMEGLQKRAHEAGYEILLLNSSSPSSWQDKVDGAIFHQLSACDYAALQSPPPLVNVLTSVPGLACVVADEYEGGYQATRHLLDLGHRRIAYLLDDSYGETRMRLAGYQAALRDAKVKASSDWVRVVEEGNEGKLWPQCGKTEMLKWLASGWKKASCTALLCHNDEMALGVLEALRDHKIRVPQDLSIVGYDGTILCETLHPELTSVKVPMREIGFRAAGLLIEQIESGQAETATVALPITMQLRGSTSRLTNTIS